MDEITCNNEEIIAATEQEFKQLQQNTAAFLEKCKKRGLKNVEAHPLLKTMEETIKPLDSFSENLSIHYENEMW